MLVGYAADDLILVGKIGFAEVKRGQGARGTRKRDRETPLEQVKVKMERDGEERERHGGKGGEQGTQNIVTLKSFRVDGRGEADAPPTSVNPQTSQYRNAEETPPN